MERFQRDLMRGSLDLMVLSVLADGPRYGYSIQKRLREASGNMVRMQPGTLYPLLHRLETDGAIRAQWAEEGGRRRKWYQLTAAGKRRLNQQASQWQEYVKCLQGLLGGVGGGPEASNG